MKKIKILVSNQEYFATLGINRHQSVQHQPFNVKNLLPSLKFSVCVILCGGFLINEANSFIEYTESVYFTSATIAVAIIFLTFVWNMENYFNFIDGWERCVEKNWYNCSN